MRVGIRACLVVLSLLGLTVPGVAAAGTDPRGLDPAAVDRFIEDYRAHTGLPGVTVAITKGREVVHTAGYGHDSSGAALTAHTRMPIASLSKSFTALGLLQLVEAGRVELDAPVRRYLPEFHTADSRGERITVRQLLNQTSGMADTAYPDLRMPQAHDLTGAVERLGEARLADDPGTRFHYHNPNYQVAARIIEVVSGIPYAQYLRERVLTPLGMRDTDTVNTAADAKDVAHGYIRVFGLPVAEPEPDWFVGGSHGMITTAADIAQWLIAQNNGGTAQNGTSVLSPTSIELTHKPSEREDYGMGWWQGKSDDAVRIYHTGDWFTYTAEQILLPESGYGIAILADTGLAVEGDVSVLANGLVALAQGHEPTVRYPGGVYADWVLAALSLGGVAAGGFAIVRSRRWAQRRKGEHTWRTIARFVPYLAPAAILALLPQLAGYVFAGRAGNFIHVMYVWPALVISLGVGTITGLAVVIARGIRLATRRSAE
ncbi:serine hydrolase domain-containing protein [Nocardia panacis]|uniref:serine hydrolase domain-containing protein n=1 Tax=Nocardia panacis TaxID=2340916 RepID=UPI00131511FD|nr:serine hydrolase domain-containing protein [Nocardia panacis]